MSLTVEKLNDDATFIFAFAPPFAPQTNNRKFPGAFTILVDPWLQGSSAYLHPSFQEAQHTGRCMINSLSDLQEPPDLIIISQEKPDHCHQETLCSLPKNTTTTILATPPAAKKIQSWGYFDEDTVQVLRPYNPKDGDTVFRASIPSYTTSSSEGEITVANVVTKYDVTGLHNAIGITYRSPGSILSALKRESVNLTELLKNQSPRPSTAPTQPKLRQSKSASRLTLGRNKDASLSAPSTPKGRPRTASSSRKPTFDTESLDKTYTSPSRPPAIPPSLGTRSRTDSHTSTTTTQPLLNITAHREKPLTVLYTPHGISVAALQPYLTHYLEPQQASSSSNNSSNSTPSPPSSNLKNPPPPAPPSPPPFRLTALFHCLNTETNPIFLGGTVAHGAPGGVKLAKALHARNWIGTHDEVKVLKGWSTMWIRSTRFGVEEVRGMLRDGGGEGTKEKVGHKRKDGGVFGGKDGGSGEMMTTEVHCLEAGGRLRVEG
ncbi:hypothetical protein D0861_04577 [Hortaea werneckii]|uniref:Uncharacterized protein n=1 Tax=Hortaea werneckii TaxID=91943 RepID=A0A3M7FIV7_HORWE|nr:hypothetical protein KC361_g1882 [Hortaea werneckii]KAI7512382.1 hypothetical protein KC347_g2495 [Hortaea werneckii]RMY88830.1 hypothetical protein D0861_04577 [Hortaea werneckii]